MIGSILVPLDGSEFGERALPWATVVARGAAVPVQLVHVHVPHVPDHLLQATQFQYEGVDMDEYDRRDLSDESRYLDDVAEEMRSAAGHAVRTAVLVGNVTGAVERYAAAQGTGLVVMSTHGRTGASRVWLGSRADELVRHTHLPLFLVPPQDNVEGTPRVDRILVALDGTEFAEQVLETCLDLAAAVGAGLLLYTAVLTQHVVGARSTPVPATRLAERTREARGYLEGIRDRLVQEVEGLDVDVRVTEEASAARGILTALEQTGAQAVALATHGYKPLQRAVLGSVADKILRGSSAPVLLRRPV